MKNTKRSLIISIAVLCVCALSLSTATFAWFSKSETAKVEDLQLKVLAQSDLKIAVDPQALENGESAFWMDKLTDDQIKAVWAGDTISDVTPANASFDGTFKAPSDADRETIGDDGAFNGTLVETTSGFYHFKLYVRTTGNAKSVVYNTTGFSLKNTGVDAGKTSLGAVSLGDTSSKNISVGTTAANNVKIAQTVSALKQIGTSNYYYAEVDFYIWVEGTDTTNCRNSKALNEFTYGNTISFTYGEAFA